MKRVPAAQRGAVLLLLLAVMLAVVLGTWHPAYQAERAKSRREATLVATLQQAKEALLARAVNDSNRPGSLPCPDLMTDSPGLANTPGDGKADNLTRNDCPSYVGWLPWVTLDLPELVDESGSRLWYVLTPEYRDEDNAPPLNADTTGQLSLDGSAGMAALIIAPGLSLGTQQRTASDDLPSRRIADYLDGENANGDDHRYASGPRGIDFNDRVLAITRDELMAATGKRIAGEIRRCLYAHASSPSNLQGRLPWPAPLVGADGQGRVGSRFGRMPLTTPTPGPALALSEIAPLLGWPDAAPLTQSQFDALQTLQQTLGSFRRLLQHLTDTSNRLSNQAGTLTLQFSALDSSILRAEENNRISATERSNIRNQSTAALQPLAQLEQILSATGFDFFPVELGNLAKTLPQGQQFNIDTATLPPLLALKHLLTATSTSSTAIAPRLDTALRAVADSEQAVRTYLQAPTEAGLKSMAEETIRQVQARINELMQGISASRTNTTPEEIRGVLDMLAASHGPASDSEQRLARLSESRNIIAAIRGGTSEIIAARNESLAEFALALANTAGTTLLPEPLVNALRTLEAAIAGNDNNLTRSSLQRTAAEYRASQAHFMAYTAPTQAEMVPHAENLRSTAVNIAYWVEIIQRHATQTTRLASLESSNEGSGAISAGQAAKALESSLNNSLKALGKLLDNPGSSTLRASALKSLAAAQNESQQLASSLANLSASFSSSNASNFPMLWHAAPCDFLQQAGSWWIKNEWHAQVFYQIGDIFSQAGPTLAINGSTQRHRLIALSAGPALAGQSRQAVGEASSYLEKENAHSSRNGLALNPIPIFHQAPLTEDFNDQLAF